MEVFQFSFGLVVAAVIAVVVAKDANSRGMSGVAWGIGVFCLCIVFLPLYLIVRKPPLAVNRVQTPASFGSDPTPFSPQELQRPNFCSNCGTSLPPVSRFCPGCGAQIG